MRSTLGTLTIAWAAVYGYVCFYYFALWLRRRAQREYLSFALIAASLAVTSIGAALLDDAITLEEGERALDIKAAGLAMASGFLVDFIHSLTGRGGRRLVIAAYVSMVAVLAVVLSGNFYQHGVAAPRPTWGLAFAPDFAEPALAPAGAAAIILAWSVVGLAFAPSSKRAETERPARFVLVATSTSLVAMAHDILVHVGSLRSFYVSEHAALLAVFAMSRLLIDRLERSRDALELRERELSRSYDELRETEEALVKKEQLAAVGAFSGVIATEVRAPLEAIRDATHGLARDADSEERSAVLVQVDAQVERLNRLVNDILTYARPVAPEMQPIDVRALVEAAIARVRSLGTRHAAAVKSALHGSEARIHGDPDLLRRAIDSVVDHVVAAMPGGGEFVVRLEKATLSGQPALSVVFHDAEAPSAAEPREHAPPFTTADARGLKLGLAIVERVVHVHGGKLTIRDGDGDGALVTMTFPRRRASTETERARA